MKQNLATLVILCTLGLTTNLGFSQLSSLPSPAALLVNESNVQLAKLPVIQSWILNLFQWGVDETQTSPIPPLSNNKSHLSHVEAEEIQFPYGFYGFGVPASLPRTTKQLTFQYSESRITLYWDDEGLVENCEFEEFGSYGALPLPPEVKEQQTHAMPIQDVTFYQMLDLMKGCEGLGDGRNKTDNSSSSSSFDPLGFLEAAANSVGSVRDVLFGFIPGTKFCGPNNVAKGGWNDLGDNRALDSCCRTHSLCPIKVKSFSERYGLVNLNVYTSSHCECEALFYDCLKKAMANSTSNAELLGNFFFDVLRLQCIQEEGAPACVQRKDETDLSCLFWGESKTYIYKPNLHFREFDKYFANTRMLLEEITAEGWSDIFNFAKNDTPNLLHK